MESTRINIKESIIEEGNIPGHTKALSIFQMDQIKEQMKKSICKIDENGKIKGTGFLCLIPNPNIDHLLKVLITCNHVFNDLTNDNKIKLIFEDGKEQLLIIDESRKKYTNKEYDITIIELKENEFNLNNYLTINNDIYKLEKFNEIYKNKQIYIIHYPNGNEVKYSIDFLKSIDENNNIYHCCDTDHGSSGSPILSLHNFQVIGIHIGRHKNLNFNIGKLIKFPIDDFNEKIKIMKNKENNNNKKVELNNINQSEEKIINEIILLLEIEKEDINKKIYFLDNTDYTDDETKEKHYHDNLKELNETNTKLYINRKEYKYCKYIKPLKEGTYEIKLIIYIKMKNCSYMFYKCEKIIKINLLNLNILLLLI